MKNMSEILQAEVNNTAKYLQQKNIILYPTDTVWGIGCDATCEETVANVFKIKQRTESKSLIILVDGIEMLKKYISNIPSKVLDLLQNVEKPTTIIYNHPIGLAKNVVASDNTVAIRIPQNEFCKQLISAFGKPIVSTSANISGDNTPQSFKEINKVVLDTVDYIVNLQREEINDKSSTILKLDESGEIIVLRN